MFLSIALLRMSIKVNIVLFPRNSSIDFSLVGDHRRVRIEAGRRESAWCSRPLCCCRFHLSRFLVFVSKTVAFLRKDREKRNLVFSDARPTWVHRLIAVESTVEAVS